MRLKKTKTKTAPAADPGDGKLGERVAAASNAKCYVLRYWAKDEALIGRDPELSFTSEFVGLAATFKPGDRIFLQAWEGGEPTGRARLVLVRAIEKREADETLRAICESTWAWSQGATVETLKALSWAPEPLISPVYAAPRPVEPFLEGLNIQTTTESRPHKESCSVTVEGFERLFAEIPNMPFHKLVPDLEGGHFEELEEEY